MTTAMLSSGDERHVRDAIGPLAWAFHRQVLAAGQGSDADGVVAMAAALLMRATVNGHICLTLDEIVEQAASVHVPFAGAAELRRHLGAHPWVGAGDGTSPLVFENEQLYLRRFREAEVRLATAIRTRIAASATNQTLPALAPRFREVFPPGKETDWQAVAVAASLRSRLSIITGGPGTGKTTTVARLLAMLLAQDPEVRVALTAPTGKAATRLGEAVQETLRQMGVDDATRERLPSAGRTLHRLLGYRPQDDSFRRSANDPLEHDVVIVDEASMVPLLLMDALFAAVRPDARIVLLGDHNQLASVEAGSVLADIVEASGALTSAHGAALVEAYGILSGQRLPSDANTAPLRDAVVRLERSHRFDDTKGIGALARAIRDGDADGAVAVLQRPDESLARGAESAQQDDWMEWLAEPARGLFAAASPDAALAALGRVRVLCATNVGPAGTDALTPRIEQMLRHRGHDVSGRFYRGRPLLLTRNDYALGLFNGDIGVVWDEVEEDGSSVQRAFISSPDFGEAAKGFPLPQLPEAVTAWAMTVHKSQGSEFNTVVVLLPESDVRTLTRELLYTAVTRAKARVIIVGPDDALRMAIGRTARRGSGLAGRLG